jgi:hypothetical protein
MKMAVRWTVVTLVVGAVLIVLGTDVIEGSRHAVTRRFGVDSADGYFVYYVWTESQLAVGIAMALVGTATSAASLTYLYMNRKKKGV